MKKRIARAFAGAILIIAAAGMMTACGPKIDPAEIVKTGLESIPSSRYEAILDENIELQLGLKDLSEMSEEMRKEYISYIEDVYSHMDYELGEAEKGKNGSYKVEMTIKQIELNQTMEEVIDEYLSAMKVDDKDREFKEMLQKEQEQLEHLQYAGAESITLTFYKGDKGYRLDDKQIDRILEMAVEGDFLSGYIAVHDMYYVAEYVQAWMDASMKGEVDAYCAISESSREEVLAEYEENFDLINESNTETFSVEEQQQLIGILKAACKSAQYEIGNIKYTGEMEYTADITISPNLTFKEAQSYLEARVNSGAIRSEAQLKQEFFAKLNELAAAPVYGEPQTVTIELELFLGIFRSDSATEVFELILPMK